MLDIFTFISKNKRTGKSTLAGRMAELHHSILERRSGYSPVPPKIALVDCSESGDLSRWHSHREWSPGLHVFCTSGVHYLDVLSDIQDGAYTAVYVDLPENSLGDEVLAAFSGAQFVMPALPGQHESELAHIDEIAKEVVNSCEDEQNFRVALLPNRWADPCSSGLGKLDLRWPGITVLSPVPECEEFSLENEEPIDGLAMALLARTWHELQALQAPVDVVKVAA